MEVSLGDSHLYVVSNSMFVPIDCFELFVLTPLFSFCLPALYSQHSSLSSFGEKVTG